MATPTPLDHSARDYRKPEDEGYVELTDEEASQGFKTGHMPWVLAIGFALAGIGLGLTALMT